MTATIRVGRRPTRLAVAADAVWALNAGDGTVSRIDPRSNTTVATVRVGAHATDLTVAGGLVWVSAAGGTAKAGCAPVPSVLQPLPASSCSPVMIAPPQTPRRLIAVSLPLRLSGGLAARMTAAIGRVIQAARYRAGRFAIGYQVCDDSVRHKPGWDTSRCPANAQAYARDRSVIGVIGPYNSVCAAVGLLNTAPGGPVAIVSPATTLLGLTRASPWTAADEPDRYYPTGTRSFARVVAADDRQGAALALLARQLGTRRAFTLDDGQTYGRGLAGYFAQAAGKLHFTVVGSASWDFRQRTYARLARRVARRRPDTVLLAGCICEHGARVIRDLRAVLGSRPHLTYISE